jgi:hypothetical protein
VRLLGEVEQPWGGSGRAARSRQEAGDPARSSGTTQPRETQAPRCVGKCDRPDPAASALRARLLLPRPVAGRASGGPSWAASDLRALRSPRFVPLPGKETNRGDAEARRSTEQGAERMSSRRSRRIERVALDAAGARSIGRARLPRSLFAARRATARSSRTTRWSGWILIHTGRRDRGTRPGSARCCRR